MKFSISENKGTVYIKTDSLAVSFPVSLNIYAFPIQKRSFYQQKEKKVLDNISLKLITIMFFR